MGKTRLYMIRHGQSEGNLKNLFLGHTDMDLTELGHRQAEKTAEYLATVPVDVIYASDLKRAFNTALHTAEKKGIPARPDPELREIFAGDWEGVLFSDLETKYAESFGVWRGDFGASRCDGGESVAELKDRIYSAVERIAKENEGKSVCLFSHATPIRLMGGAAKGLSLKEMGEFPWPTNASVTSFEYENGVFTLLEYSRDDFMGNMITSLSNI